MPGGLAIGAMAHPVEARSLASLNLLAANPPQYPVNPTEEKQPALILYISRVPGTRDVILSPFKPHIKNVTAEDVANSLYYIHLELPSDQLSPPAPIRDPDTPRSSRESSRTRSQNQIPRKPLPPNSKVSSKISLPQESSTGSGELDARPQTPRSDGGVPVTGTGSGVEKASSPSSSESDKPPLPPRPLSGVSLGYEVPMVSPELPHPSKYQSPTGGGSPTSKSRPLGPRPQPDGRAGDQEKRLPATPELVADYRQTTRKLPSRSSSPTKLFDNFTPLTPFTISMIRRDPSSEHQWNIGKVTSQQVEPEDESGYMHQRPAWEPGPAAPPINIFIETSGYCKFRGGLPHRQQQPVDGQQRDSTSSLPWSLREPGGSPTESGFTGFSRQAVMTYSKSWTSGIRERFRRSESIDDTNAPPPPPPPRTHARGDSTNSVESVEAPGGPSEAPITQPASGLKPRGYMFVSPWDGRCEFRTGSGGRSVTCRHILPESTQANTNPLAPGSSPPDRIMAIAGSHPQISELRFSLPSKELFGSSRDEASPHRHGHHFSRLFKHHSGGDHPSSDEEGSGVSYDMSLGKEKAGGGSRGKKAKMGKLIVFDEGLKMLDLVVAANMGIWWGAWERSF